MLYDDLISFILVFTFFSFISQVYSEKQRLSLTVNKIGEFSDKCATDKRNCWLASST